MKKNVYVIILICVILFVGCSKKETSKTPIKDGLKLTYKLEIDKYPEQNHTSTYIFKKIGDDKYEVMIERQDKTLTKIVNPQFRDYDSPEYAGTIPGPSGGYLWTPPEELHANNVKHIKIIEKTTYNGYEVYKSKSTRLKFISYHDIKTGFLIATVNMEGGMNILSELIETNANGL